MKNIEQHIRPLIKQQFPDFYRDDGPLFITFVEAYYEWMENNLQEIVLRDSSNFNLGDTIKQGSTTGTIVSQYDKFHLVQIDSFDRLVSVDEKSAVEPITSSSGGLSSIEDSRSFNQSFFSRNLTKIRDVDRTIESFIVHFKNKYLPNIQFTTASSKELFIKNSLDFYRAKGTERAVDLFFKLIYGFEARVYYPGDDLFRPSDNTWIDVKYVELEPSDFNVNMVGQVVYGSKSEAFGYGDRLVRVKKGSRYINVLYLSNVEGTFVTGEQAYTIDLDQNVTAKVTGSLTEFDINVSSPGFEIGERLYVSDGIGKKGQARVNQIETFVGAVDFQLIDGGWGYSSNASIITSDRILNVANVEFTDTEYYSINNPFAEFDTIHQDLHLFTANTDAFDVNDQVTGYDANDQVVIDGSVVAVTDVTDSVVVHYSSNTYPDANTFATIDVLKTAANATFANVVAETDVTASANVMAIGATSTIEYRLANNNPLDSSTRLQNGDDLTLDVPINNVVRQVANAQVDEAFTIDSGDRAFATIRRDTGAFRTNLAFNRQSDQAEYAIEDMSNTLIGIHQANNSFYPNASIYSDKSGSTGVILSNLAYETEASFTISSLENVQTLENLADQTLINEVGLGTAINATSYGLANSPVSGAGYLNVISDVTAFANVDVGSVKVIVTTNPGVGYSVDPFFRIEEPATKHLERYDYFFQYEGSDVDLLIGETLKGQTSGAEAVLTRKDNSSQTLHATRIHLADDFTAANDFVLGETLTGQQTNISVTITSLHERRRHNRTGLNANVLSEAFSGEGFTASLSVIDSGFGYSDGEVLNLVSLDDPSRTVSAISRIGEFGQSEGYHTDRKSFLSSDKYLHDSDYYQEYSYEVLTSLPFDKYKQTLIDVLHVAGTKPFGSYVGTSEETMVITVDDDDAILSQAGDIEFEQTGTLGSSNWSMIVDLTGVSTFTFENVGTEDLYIAFGSSTTPPTEDTGLLYTPGQGETNVDPSTLTIEPNPTYVFARAVQGTTRVYVTKPNG